MPDSKQIPKYRLPAEWDEHSVTILAWPHNSDDWPGKFTPVHWVYVEIVRKITLSEFVIILFKDANQKDKIVRMLGKAHVDIDKVQFMKMQTDRSWVRDSMPFFVRSGSAGRAKVFAVNFRFNAWAKYDNWKKDDKAGRNFPGKLNIDSVQATHKNKEVVLEGGAVDTNGRGTLLTTEECLLHPDVQLRNPGFTKEDYKSVFKEYFGAPNVIFLKKGIVGDDTHGHVDDLCRFVNSNTIVICSEKNPRDENYEALKENYEILKESKLEDGSSPNLIKLPMPEPLYFDGIRLPASYANFYITNKNVLVPVFNDPNDRIALKLLSAVFPDRNVIGINCVDIVWGLGTLHCLTHELPAV